MPTFLPYSARARSRKRIGVSVKFNSLGLLWNTLQKVYHCAVELGRLFQIAEMACALNADLGCAGNTRLHEVGCLKQVGFVPLAGDDQRRRGDLAEPLNGGRLRHSHERKVGMK